MVGRVVHELNLCWQPAVSTGELVSGLRALAAVLCSVLIWDNDFALCSDWFCIAINRMLGHIPAAPFSALSGPN